MKMFHSLNRYLLNTYYLPGSFTKPECEWYSGEQDRESPCARRAYIPVGVVAGCDGDFKFINDLQKIKHVMRME